ncbi:MAG: hypothetical protein Tsb005_19410 [Gammaproteobacteria bacterium]
MYLKLGDDPSFKNSRIIVGVYHRTMLLAGQVPHASLRLKAERYARTLPKVEHIYNAITIEPPVAAVVPSQDAWITTQIKTLLTREPLVPANKIKVITENGVTYLMGNITHEQGDLAIKTARQLGGVKRVVTLFNY